jgi:TolB-like protein/class 3 adenylate cyclase/Tfp pilus assembly protein PilF
MAEQEKTKLRLEIAHVLFIDIVGYSKLLIDEQSEALQELNTVVRNTESAREAGAAGQLIYLPTGDGMALVFTGSVEDPVECALQISHALRAQPSLPVRMGIHSGPVHHVADVNQRDNIAGAGINIAQRVMDCGDAGHILVSKRVADDLAQYRRWQPYLHELGDFEAKHGQVVSVVNLYADIVGNPNAPSKFKPAAAVTPQSSSEPAAPAVVKSSLPWHELVLGGLILLGVIAAAIYFFHSRTPQQTGTQPMSAPTMANAAGIPAKSIAVLPFENLSEEKQNAFFTEGVQDQILTNLAKIADLKVISRTSVMQYQSGAPRNLREIGQQLGVAHVVEGSVQRAADRVRVSAQLIDARNDSHVWAETYDRDLADVFAIQSEIAKAIADQLQARLSPSEKAAIERAPTSDVVAFDLYSRARDLITNSSFSALARKNMEDAIQLLNQALARDPSFVLAYCQIAAAHGQLYFTTGIDHTAKRLGLAQAAVDAAFRVSPDAGEAHLARGELLYRGYLDYEGALKELETARKRLPNDPRIPELIGFILRRQGKREEGLGYIQRALEIDPRNFGTLQQIALSYWYLHRFPETIAALERAIAIKPDDPEIRVARATADLDWKADTHSLHNAIEEIRSKNPAALPKIADTWLLCALAERDAAAAASALSALGDNTFGDNASQFSAKFGEGLVGRMMRDEAIARAAFLAARDQQQNIVNEQPGFGPPLGILGLIDAALGRKEEALAEGRRAVELLPVSKDATNGPDMIRQLSIIAAWVGDEDMACEQLTKSNPMEGYGSAYGRLKLLPWWDPLRGDPRFEKIVASLAPTQNSR